MARSSATAASRSSVSRNGLVLADLRQKPHSCAGKPCLAACVVLLVIGIASPALAAQVSPRVLAAAQAFWAEYNQGQSPCSSVTVTYFDGPVLATDEPLHNGEASIGYPASSFHGAPVSQPCDLRQPTAGRAIARLSVRGRRPRDRSRRNGARAYERPHERHVQVHDRAAPLPADVPAAGRFSRADHGRGIAMMRGLIYDTPLDLELIRSRAARE